MFTRDDFHFDVGSSMMFGMGHEGTTNLITKALQAAGKELETIPDPTQIHYHLPKSAAHPEVLQSFCTSVTILVSLPSVHCIEEGVSHNLCLALTAKLASTLWSLSSHLNSSCLEG